MAVFTAIGASVAAAFGLAAGTAGFTFVAGVTAASLQLLAGIGLSQIGKSLAGQEAEKIIGTQFDLRSGEATPRSLAFGYLLTAGSLVYYNTWGTAQGLVSQVIAVADKPIQAYGRVFIDDSPITLGAVEHATRGWPALEFRKNGVDYLWVKFHDGTQTTADTLLTTYVSSAARPYTSDRVGYGVPYVIVTAQAPPRDDSGAKPLFSGIPKVKIEVATGTKLYNPADGAQDPSDESTWGGTGDHNPAVQLYNIMRGVKFGTEWLYGLQNIADAQLPAADWATQITKAQAAINKPGGGTEPTYRSGGEIIVGVQTTRTVDALLTAMQGRLISVGGMFKLRLGAPDAFVYDITDADIIDTEEQSFVPFLSLADTITGISGTFPNPASGWTDKVLPARNVALAKTRAGNRNLMASVSLDMVPYKAQAQRLIKSALTEAQRERRHTWTLGPEAWKLEPGDVVRVNSVRNGYVNKLFRVDGWLDKENLDVVVELVEVDPSDYDWDSDTDFNATVDGPTSQIPVPALAFDGWLVYPATINDHLGNPRRPSIGVQYTGGISDIRSVRVLVRIHGTGTIIYDQEIPYAAPYSQILTSGNFSPNTQYDAQGIFIRYSGEEAEPSTWDAVTTPDVRFGSKDITDGAITIDMFPPGTLQPVQVVTSLGSAVAAEGNLAVLTTDGRLYRYHSGVWTAEVPANVISGQIVTAQINAAAITANELATGAVTALKIAALAVATANIQVGAITATELAAGSVITAKLAASAVDGTKLAAAAVSNTHIVANTITADRLVANSITTRELVITDPSNLVANEDFNPTGFQWTTSGATWTSITRAAAVTSTGVNAPALAMTTVPGNTVNGIINSNLGQFTPCKPGDEFWAQFSYGQESGVAYTSGNLKIVVEFDRVTGGPTSSTVAFAPSLPASGTWNTVTGSVVAPANACGVRIFVQYTSAGGGFNGTVYVTRAQLRRKNAGELIVDGSITTVKLAANSVTANEILAGAITTIKISAGAVTANEIATDAITAIKVMAGTITGDKLVANAITARELVLADFRNLVPNGGWDDASNNWAFTASGGTAPQFHIVTSSLALTGSRIGRIDKGTGALTSQCYIDMINPMPVVAGSDYWFETSVRGITGTNQAAGFVWRAYWFQSDGVTPSATPFNNINGDVALTTTFTQWGNRLTVPSDASYCRIRMYHNSSGTTLRWMAIGYVICRKADGASLIVDGTITANALAANSVTAAKVAANAITAGTISAGAINVSSLFVSGVAITSVLANAAVTDKVVDGSIPTSIVPTTSDQTLASINVSSQGYPMAVGSYIDFTTAVGALTRDYTFSLYVTISATLILVDQVVAAAVGASTTRRVSLGGVIMPSGAGPYNVTMRIKSSGASTTVTINDATLVATVTKK